MSPLDLHLLPYCKREFVARSKPSFIFDLFFSHNFSMFDSVVILSGKMRSDFSKDIKAKLTSRTLIFHEMPVNTFPEFFFSAPSGLKKNRFTNPKPLALRREVAVFFLWNPRSFARATPRFSFFGSYHVTICKSS